MRIVKFESRIASANLLIKFPDFHDRLWRIARGNIADELCNEITFSRQASEIYLGIIRQSISLKVCVNNTMD